MVKAVGFLLSYQIDNSIVIREVDSFLSSIPQHYNKLNKSLVFISGDFVVSRHKTVRLSASQSYI